MQEIATMVDMRFGHGTWRSIVDERAKRIREAKEAAALARKEAARKQKEFQENIKQAMLVISVILVMVGLFVIMMIWVAKASLNDPLFISLSQHSTTDINFTSQSP